MREPVQRTAVSTLSKELPPDTATKKKAGWHQVAATLFWGMVMIGKRNTWEKDGVTVTMTQVVVGAIIAGIVVVSLLVFLARVVAR